MQLSAARVIATVVSNGNLKYLKDVLPLLEHERALTRVAGIGKRRRLEQEVRAAAIRAIRKRGVPDDIVRLGVKAMEVAIERHSLGYKYELPPTFYEENGLNLDGTPTNTLAPRA